MSSNLQRLPLNEIRQLIADTEQALAELKAELVRRETEAQDYEIEHLENHMKNAEISLNTIRDFLAFIMAEHRSK